MSKKPPVKLKLVTTSVEEEQRDPRALIKLDWYAAGILCVILALSPLIAGDFATSPDILPIVSTWNIVTAAGVPLLLIFAAIAFLPFAIREWTRPVAIGAVTGLVPSFLLLICWAALSTVRTPALYLTVNALALLAAIALCAGMIGRLARDRNAIATMLISITAGGTLTAISGIWEYIGYFRQHVPQWRSFATFTSPSFLAGYLLITIPVALGLFVSAKDLRIRVLAGLALVIQSSGMWLSGSRAAGAIVLAEIAIFIGAALYVNISADRAKWLRIALVLFVVGSLPALTPLLSRLSTHAPPPRTAGHGAGVASADPQVNSNEFRRWTWIGTVRMAQANPVLGTGFGAWETSYARYAETAFTAHAHNSYLQLMSEAGYPAVLFLTLGLAAAAAFIAHCLMLQRKGASQPEGAEIRLAASEGYHRLLGSPDLLLCGLLAACAGSMIHNLTDSDWYVAANALTLGAAIALAIAIARDIAPLSTYRPVPMHRAVIVIGGVAAALVLLRGVQLAKSRMYQSLGASDIRSLSSSTITEEQQRTVMAEARESYLAAAAADPLDPEPYLGVAEVTPQEEKLASINKSIAICPTGKAYHRLGQYYMALKEYAKACEAFEQSSRLQPKMVQNLRSLAEAYLAFGKADDAVRILERITALQHTPYGTVRAMHESVETDFAYAHALLGGVYTSRDDWTNAATEYEQARDVLSEYWIGRSFLVYAGRSPEWRNGLADLYENVLTQLKAADLHLNRPADAEAAQAKLDKVQSERKADDSKRQSAE